MERGRADPVLMVCPNCKTSRSEGQAQCLHCGIIYEKWEARQSRRQAGEASQDEEFGLDGAREILETALPSWIEAQAGIFFEKVWKIFGGLAAPPHSTVLATLSPVFPDSCPGCGGPALVRRPVWGWSLGRPALTVPLCGPCADFSLRSLFFTLLNFFLAVSLAAFFFNLFFNAPWAAEDFESGLLAGGYWKAIVNLTQGCCVGFPLVLWTLGIVIWERRRPIRILRCVLGPPAFLEIAAKNPQWIQELRSLNSLTEVKR